MSISGFGLNLFNQSKNRLAKTSSSGALILKKKFEVTQDTFLQRVEVFPSNQDLPKTLEFTVNVKSPLIASSKLFVEFGPNSGFESQNPGLLASDAFGRLVSGAQLWNSPVDPDFAVANDLLLREWVHLDFLKGLTGRDRFFSAYSLNPQFSDPNSNQFLLDSNVQAHPERANLFRDFYLNSSFFRNNFQTLLARSSFLRRVRRDSREPGFLSEANLLCTSEGRLRIFSACRMKLVEGRPSLELTVADDYDPASFAEPNFLTRVQIKGLQGFSRKGDLEPLSFWGSFNEQKILEQTEPFSSPDPDVVTRVSEQTPQLPVTSFFWEAHTETELVYLRLLLDVFPHEFDPVTDFLVLEFPTSFGFHARYDVVNEEQSNATEVACSDRHRPDVSVKCHVSDESRLILKFVGVSGFVFHKGSDNLGADAFHLELPFDFLIHNILLPNFQNASPLRNVSDLFFREANAHIFPETAMPAARRQYYLSRHDLNLHYIPLGVYSSTEKRFRSYSPDGLSVQVQRAGQWLPYFNILGKNYFIRERSDLFLFFGVPLKDLPKLDRLEVWLELDPLFFISSDYVDLIRPLCARCPCAPKVSSEAPSVGRSQCPSRRSTRE